MPAYHPQETGTPRGWGSCPLATPPLPRALPTSWLWVSSPLGAAPAVISLTLIPHPKAGRCEPHLTDTHAEAQSPGVGQGHEGGPIGSRACVFNRWLFNMEPAQMN